MQGVDNNNIAISYRYWWRNAFVLLNKAWNGKDGCGCNLGMHMRLC